MRVNLKVAMKENVYNTNQGCHGTRGGGWGHHSTLLLCRLWSLWVASTGVLSSIINLVNTVVLAEREERTCKLKRMEKIDQVKKGEGPPTKRAWHVPGPWDREELRWPKDGWSLAWLQQTGWWALCLEEAEDQAGPLWPLQGVCLLLFLSLIAV